MADFKDVRPSLHLAERLHIVYPRAAGHRGLPPCGKRSRTALDTDKNTRPSSGPQPGVNHNYPLERGIKDAIISRKIADNASHQLADIRQMRLCNDRIKEKLRVLTQSSSFSKYLQEPLVTVRNGRYVIPVKQEYRQNVPGLVHDQSSTGATLFIEPMAVVKTGNELKQWALKEDQEIERILAAFSAQVVERCHDCSQYRNHVPAGFYFCQRSTGAQHEGRRTEDE